MTQFDSFNARHRSLQHGDLLPGRIKKNIGSFYSRLLCFSHGAYTLGMVGERFSARGFAKPIPVNRRYLNRINPPPISERSVLSQGPNLNNINERLSEHMHIKLEEEVRIIDSNSVFSRRVLDQMSMTSRYRQHCKEFLSQVFENMKFVIKVLRFPTEEEIIRLIRFR
ncbi:MAG: hypothetical protein N2654_04945 [Deltaproteobacteria bacterium]|nr:hypothetical protein [Deltaproteobacteria bacterium]